MVLESGSRVGRSPFGLSTPGLEMRQDIAVVYRKESKNSASSSVFTTDKFFCPIKELIKTNSSVQCHRKVLSGLLNKQGNICIKTLLHISFEKE